VKWVQRLRGNSNPPAGKFLAYEKDEAHVYTIPRYYEARGHDLAILDLWAEGRLNLSSPTATRKNRRIRYTMAQQKRQQKQQDGGRRRRRATRKVARKARRGTRRQQRK